MVRPGKRLRLGKERWMESIEVRGGGCLKMVVSESHHLEVRWEMSTCNFCRTWKKVSQFSLSISGDETVL